MLLETLKEDGIQTSVTMEITLLLTYDSTPVIATVAIKLVWMSLIIYKRQRKPFFEINTLWKFLKLKTIGRTEENET